MRSQWKPMEIRIESTKSKRKHWHPSIRKSIRKATKSSGDIEVPGKLMTSLRKAMNPSGTSRECQGDWMKDYRESMTIISEPMRPEGNQ